jgi:hypothetical protein
MAQAPNINVQIEFLGHCASCGAAMPSTRAQPRPLLTQILSPEVRPDLALKLIASLHNHIAELEQTLAADEMLLQRRHS